MYFLVTLAIILTKILIKRISDNITKQKSGLIDFNIYKIYIPSEKKIKRPVQLAPFLYFVSISVSQSCVFATAWTLMNHFNLPGNRQFAKTICKNQLELVLIVTDVCIVSRSITDQKQFRFILVP